MNDSPFNEAVTSVSAAARRAKSFRPSFRSKKIFGMVMTPLRLVTVLALCAAVPSWATENYAGQCESVKCSVVENCMKKVRKASSCRPRGRTYLGSRNFFKLRP